MAHIPVIISSRNYRYKRNRRNPTNLITLNISKRNSRPTNQTGNKTISNMPTILLTNICHISNKVDDLHAIVEMNSPSLIMITESWLNTNIPDSAISIGRMFNTYRRDRPKPGGGVLAYVNACIPTTCLKNLEEDNREVLWLLLKPPRTSRPFSVIVVVGVYFPPGQSAESERELIEYITRGLDSVLRDYPSAGVCIMGDFNQMKLSRLCRRFSLKKSVKAPTRCT